MSKYVFDTNQFYSLRVKIFDHVSEDWLNYIIKNRKNIDFALNTDYDLVIGPVVDGANSWEALALYSKQIPGKHWHYILMVQYLLRKLYFVLNQKI
ncbi:DUF3990 domain-containing protein [Lactobacillus gasseri]|uniref:DUF3990 domain-containing protein n=1 Tax=Lactobacillus TaxID=1578 RepID=UPI001E587FB3|nr:MULTISPECIES: DUF3990 domain-containing protein [Lactobacillus]MCZ3538656.1 DUF3990 domain-containing protein [Lactobacillus gasseri]MCZ3540530.1 DUF3990 domain-containing protein [Lactobacillus gasseri]MCZ3547636.1 DUF3990 domain-containing protein [Lactobacillus gasseri]MCZ3549540.1 DUF3990 domain-containing protein [Lactobacillus gasseri]MCZ3551338.1 DUF3990 domain-containing protein [Lactobacillus gasseri]